MRQHSNSAKESAEKVVKEIRRATRKQYWAEEKIRTSFWKACAARTASPRFAAARGSPGNLSVVRDFETGGGLI